VLVVEDDPRLGELVSKGLREQAYAVDLVTDGESALVEASVNEYDAIVLDVGLPLKSGYQVAAELRRRGHQTPILMLTARDTVPDRVTGLDAGADDYLTKPFDFAELFARLRAILRRSPVVLPDEIVVEDLVLDTRSQQARRGDHPIALTAKEFALLELLGRRAGTVVSRAVIVSHVWDENHDPGTNAIEVYINRLRRKVDLPGHAPLIHTRRGAGYLLGPPPAAP
jgi:two-component system copper resistance phosphate regulon response regulator CusR